MIWTFLSSSILIGAIMAALSPPAHAQVSDFAIEEATIADLEAAYAAGRTTARAVTQAHLDRIAAYDKRGPLINSLITINPRALEDADQLDAALRASGRPVGLLHGIPVIIKDNIDVAGLPMTSGFQGWKNYYPSEDAPLVKKIRAAGGIILAKSSLSEFALGLGDNINSVVPGFARNPYNTAFATGGSSGGTGAALAASFGVVGIGTDTGGSVRAPSAHNALVGLRPTVGLVSRTGMVPFDSVRDTAGAMARSVADMAILLDVIVGHDPEDSATTRAEGHRSTTYTKRGNGPAFLRHCRDRHDRVGRVSGKVERQRCPVHDYGFHLASGSAHPQRISGRQQFDRRKINSLEQSRASWIGGFARTGSRGAGDPQRR